MQYEISKLHRCTNISEHKTRIKYKKKKTILLIKQMNVIYKIKIK